MVLTRKVDPLLRPAVGWFLIACVGTLAIGALVAWRFGKRLTRPIRQAEEATRRITAGDLSARVPVPTHHGDDEVGSLINSINTMAEVLERSKGVERRIERNIAYESGAGAAVDGTGVMPLIVCAILSASCFLPSARRACGYELRTPNTPDADPMLMPCSNAMTASSNIPFAYEASP